MANIVCQVLKSLPQGNALNTSDYDKLRVLTARLLKHSRPIG